MDEVVAACGRLVQHCLGKRGCDRARLANVTRQYASTCATRSRDLAMFRNGVGSVWAWIYRRGAGATSTLANRVRGTIWKGHGSNRFCVDRVARNNCVEIWRKHSHQRFDVVDSIWIDTARGAARLACIRALNKRNAWL